jgi:hypothetical protein
MKIVGPKLPPTRLAIGNAVRMLSVKTHGMCLFKGVVIDCAPDATSDKWIIEVRITYRDGSFMVFFKNDWLNLGDYKIGSTITLWEDDLVLGT